jgi:hypothetical protein
VGQDRGKAAGLASFGAGTGPAGPARTTDYSGFTANQCSRRAPLVQAFDAKLI